MKIEVPIAIQEHGLNISQLDDTKSKIVFVTPSHQFPKGIVMSARNRLQLLNWAQNNNGIIIEDDYDSEMRFLGKPIPSLKSLDKNAGVNISPVSQYYIIHNNYKKNRNIKIILSYKGISIEDIEPVIKTLNDAWFKHK